MPISKYNFRSSYVKPYLSPPFHRFEKSRNNENVCSFIVTKKLLNSQSENLTFSQMTLKEITRLNRTSPLKEGMH